MATAGTALLAGCDGEVSAVPKREPSAITEAAAAAGVTPAPTVGEKAADPRRAVAPKVNGRPMWSANRRFSAEQNARRHFERDGAAFGARSVDDYVAKAHAFIRKPPRGAQTLTRTNGDRLIYDPASNVFAVATREGAPRTMFKPREGAAYWEEVKAREAAGGARGRRGEE